MLFTIHFIIATGNLLICNVHNMQFVHVRLAYIRPCLRLPHNSSVSFKWSDTGYIHITKIGFRPDNLLGKHIIYKKYPSQTEPIYNFFCCAGNTTSLYLRYENISSVSVGIICKAPFFQFSIPHACFCCYKEMIVIYLPLWL